MFQKRLFSVKLQHFVCIAAVVTLAVTSCSLFESAGQLLEHLATATPTASYVPVTYIYSATKAAATVSPRVTQIVEANRPDFVFRLRTTVGVETGYPEEICADIDEGQIWEMGNEANELQEQLKSSVRITIDGREAVHSEDFYSYTTLSAWIITRGNDPTPEVLGSYSDITFCINIADLPEGSHTASISLTSLSGIEYTHSWRFEIWETIPFTPDA